MYKLTLENQDGQQIVFNQIGGAFTITDISGLYPPSATINTNTTALIDGARFNSSKINMRTINLAFAIEKNAESSRIQAYNVIQIKQPIRMYYQSPLRDVFIDGYVESFEISHFEMKQIATVTILCPFPHFKNAQEVINELSIVQDMFYFPFASTEEPDIVFGEIDTVRSTTVDNDGTVETGLIFELYARSEITNPRIFNYITQDFIGLNFEMQAGDLITINTMQGEKTVTLLREGTTTNIFNYVMQNSTWLQLPAGGGTFVYTVESGLQTNLEVTISHYDLYEGV